MATTVPTPPKANATNAPPSGGGSINNLVDALNKKQRKLVEEKIVEYADEYSIEFAPEWVANSTFQKPGNINFSQTPMSPNNGRVPDPARTTPLPDYFKRQFEAGESIAYIIDRVLMESSFVYNQQSVIIDKDGTPKINGVPAQSFAWYNVLCIATPTTKWDSRRRDWAYKIKYVIVPYETPVYSEYFPNGVFRGVHKSYDYWFTGLNTQVLNFEVMNNNAYFNVINTPTSGTLFKAQINAQQVVRNNYMMRSKESDQGAAERVNDIGANAADWLYNAVDYASIRFKILGDPAWINAENYSSASDVSFSPFRDDGTINFSTGAAYFEFNYNFANDYNNTTGLMDVLQSNKAEARPGVNSGGAALSFIYTAVECRSTFRGGKFEQELEGRLRLNESSDNLVRDRAGGRALVEARVPTTPPTPASSSRQPNVTAQTPAPTQPTTVTIGDKTLPVTVPELNPARRPLLNVSPRPYSPDISNPPVPSPTTPNSNGGQVINRDP